MSLKLRQTIPGRPRRESPAPLAALSTPNGAYFAYPSSTNVILVHPDGELHDTLSFWEALPYRAGPSGIGSRDVEGVVARDDTIIAWSGVYVVLWQLNAADPSPEWVVHSTIVASASISSLDYQTGTAALGTAAGVELWRVEPEAEVVVWDRVWKSTTASPPLVAIPPARTHVAWYFKGSRTVTVQTLGPRGQASGEPQDIRQPREIEWIGWRYSPSGDAQLYVISTNAILRIFATVLDDPSWFQLLYSVDHRSFSQLGGTDKGKSTDFGSIWVPESQVLQHGADDALATAKTKGLRLSPKVENVLELVKTGELDLAVWFGPNGTVALRSLLNLDRKPPTLIHSEPLGSVSVNVSANWSTRGQLARHCIAGTLFVGFPPSDSNADASFLSLSLIDLFGLDDSALIGSTPEPDFETMSVLMTQDIKQFVRTPNGRGLLAVGEGGEVGIWEKRRLGKLSTDPHVKLPVSLVGKGQWQAPVTPILYSIYAKGRGVASYFNDPVHGPRVVLQHLDPGDGTPTEQVVLPHFQPKAGDEIKMLLAVSDIDDGYSSRRRRTRRAVIMAVAASGEAWVWRIDPAPTSPRQELSQSPLETPKRSNRRLSVDSPSTSPLRGASYSAAAPNIYRSDKPITTLISHSVLPIEGGGKPRFILPVDPMGWHTTTVDWETDTPLQDMVVTVSENGVLEFWKPRLGQHMPGTRRPTIQGDWHCLDAEDSHVAWFRSSVVHTEKKNVSLARCSSRKKTVLVCELANGQHEMTIWDSNVSEFSTGLELTFAFEHGEVIQDLDWTTTSDLQSVLAVGFPHHIVLVCEQRMSYVEVTPGWAPFINIDMRKYTSVPINDSIWIAGGSFAVGVGNQIFVFSRFLEQHTPLPSPGQSVHHVEVDDNDDDPEDIFELIAHQNGPLFDFHPTMIMQCLLWDKIDLVKRILCTLVKDIREDEVDGKRRLVFQRLDPLEFHTTSSKPKKAKEATDYSNLFTFTPTVTSDDDDPFNADLVQELVDKIDGPVKIPLSQGEKSLLAALAQATLEVEQSRRSLDLCGLRYLISIRTFVNRDRRAAGQQSGAVTPRGGVPGLPPPPVTHARISFRNIVWATHSESQEVLLQAAGQACENNKMMWEDAKRLGIFLWLKSTDAIRSQMEVVARNRFMAGDGGDRDPIACSLIFFALGKKQVVHGLWRQAPGHKEQSMMMKFLANDFTLDRWKTAAAKNAYALLSKQRYEYAAAFFMLAGKPKDAITVCLRQLNDWQLAVALARCIEGASGGELLRWVLLDTVLPIAYKGGHRWLASWALWMLNRRDLAVRVLITPMDDVAEAWSETTKLPVGQPDNDDPSLLLLFQHLKGKTLQTAKGTSEISEKLEFDFVLHNAVVFCRMGCHPLGLDLLRSWSFERPYFPPPKRREAPSPVQVTTPLEQRNGMITSSPTRAKQPLAPRRRASFMLSNPHGRESMVMDMDVLSEGGTEPPTREATPPGQKATPTTPAGDLFAGMPGWGAPAAGFHKQSDTHMPTLSEEPASNGIAGPSPQKAETTNPMKHQRHGVRQGSMAFDMDSFFGNKDRLLALHVASPLPGSVFEDSGGPSRSSTPSVNLMRDLARNEDQGATEFNLDTFGFGGPAPPHVPTRTPSPRHIASNHSTNANSTTATPPASITPPNKIGLMSSARKADPAQGGAEFSFDGFDEVPSAGAKTTTAPIGSAASAASVTASVPTSTSTASGTKDASKPASAIKSKIGNLFKGHKSDASQGATEFDAGNFDLADKPRVPTRADPAADDGTPALGATSFGKVGDENDPAAKTADTKVASKVAPNVASKDAAPEPVDVVDEADLKTARVPTRAEPPADTGTPTLTATTFGKEGDENDPSAKAKPAAVSRAAAGAAAEPFDDAELGGKPRIPTRADPPASTGAVSLAATTSSSFGKVGDANDPQAKPVTANTKPAATSSKVAASPSDVVDDVAVGGKPRVPARPDPTAGDDGIPVLTATQFGKDSGGESKGTAGASLFAKDVTTAAPEPKAAADSKAAEVTKLADSKAAEAPKPAAAEPAKPSGSLMKDNKSQAAQGGADFNMDDFF
ncbi:Regulator of V-ATPase in vacuolar membrane protein 1 [Vanrija pseudolonga]|uniref:Regulator of V-ATPase in vacuolar membrane protein 1 n=1 Tax=Vanrija pseudolonga TaxID=143232 RepID=A0AAF0YAL4_9TREE|nr:Regulator of V-ATPase in vacuolar membrane protein 1 [Vanrija pseudolonga]